MNVGGLSSVLLNVSDLERSRRFYGDHLGLPLVAEPEKDHVLVFLAGPTSLVIHAHGDFKGSAVPGPEDPGAVLLFLSVDDVDAATEELRSAGVTVAAEPADQPWGERTATVFDPDGHPIFLSRALHA
jgi:catechol 2,3-dioxygenase-like lactoylglutathione lyase family enzyme